MSDNKKILLNYLLYFLTFILICFIGISGVFADTIDSYSTKYYYYFANNNSSTSSTTYRSGESNKVTLDGATAPTYSNGEGFNGFDNKISYSITKGSIYTLSLTVSYNGLLDSEFSRDTINNRLFNTNFVHCSDCTVTAISGTIRRFSSTNQGVSGLYDFDVRVNYTILATSNASTWNLGSYTGDDRTLGLDNHLYTSIVTVHTLNISNDNNSTIINQNQTIIDQNNQIINGNNQNTQDIINNNNTNTENIINNQNQNTQEQIESQQVCSVVSLKNTFMFGELRSNGTVNDIVSNFRVTDYIDIYNKSLTVLKTSGTYSCFYTNGKRFISCFKSSDIGINNEVTIPNNAFYFRTGINIQSDIPNYKICTNGNQALNDSINDLNSSLTDDSPADLSGLSNTLGWLPAGPIDSILNLPINFLNSLLTSLGGTCSPLNITIPFLNTTAEIPCLSTIFNQITGVPSYWNWVGAIASVIILYRYLLSLWAYYDRLTTMQVNFRDDFGGGV